MAKELTSLRATPAPVPGPSPAAGRRPLPQTRSGRTLRFDIGLAHGYITVGEYDDGTLGELFVIVAKEGGPLRGMLDSWARLFSVALQHGVDLADLVRAFRGSSFEPSGWSDVPGIGRAPSIPDLVVRWLEQQYLPAPAAETEQPLGAQP
jgi:ribonucleoside-diphosphate reductase alpha chain